ncbi:MAG TPA: DUF6607 family protein [Steroidobacteraceae bacterium]|nr:DUF6607 family protein [Steroidobacteraceae bacterium]
MLNLIRCALAIGVALCSASLLAADAPPASAPRYTFSWPLDGSGLMPRGGTTKGPAVTLDKNESPGWQRLQEKGISELERDRRAILAMAGTYRVTFDFLEITPFGAQDGAKAPYQSWGTEKVYVDSDTGEFISLVHILEMRIVQPDGKISEPMVTKHWRQDWTYQPKHIVEYRGADRWERRPLAASEAAGRWVQAVYQVDESPRYASLGKWQHTGSFSSWLSADTWRPLPRREWSVRQDYQVLAGTNRHTILPAGWVQEENNLKAVLTSSRELDASRPFVAREYGVARYERIRDADFAGADDYYERTKEFWDQVRDRWSKVFADRGSVTLRGPVDKLGLFKPLFAQADAIAEQGAAASKKNQEVIETALEEMGAVPGEKNDGN